MLLTPFYLWQFNGVAFEEGGQSLKLWYLAFVAVHILQSPFQSAVFYLRGVGSTVMFNLLLAAPQLLITVGYTVLYLTGNLTVTSALASTMIMMTSGWVIALTASGSWPSFGVKSEHLATIRSYALRSWVGSLSFIISLRVDQMLLVGFVDLSDLGIYAVAAALATLIGLLVLLGPYGIVGAAITSSTAYSVGAISTGLYWRGLAQMCVQAGRQAQRSQWRPDAHLVSQNHA